MMTERDDELRRVLRQWKAPEPGAALDERVLRDIRSPRRWWISVAAGVLLAGVLVMHLSQRRPEVVKADTQVVSVAVIADATGFQPMAEGKITVVKRTQ